MPKNNAAIKEFVDNIPDEKLKGFVSSEKTIVENRNIGFRLDHQGVNKDGSGKDRLYIQPLARGKTRASRMSSSSVLAQIHVTDPGDPKQIRDALFNSFKNQGRLITLA